MTTVDDHLAALRRGAGEMYAPGGSALMGGVVEVQGSKNAALKILPTTAVHGADYVLRRLPLIADTLEQLHILELLGASVTIGEDTTLVDTRTLANTTVSRDLTRRTTASFYFAGALLSRFGEAIVGLPGGDDIGLRSIDLHLSAFRALGATVEVHDDLVHAWYPSTRSANSQHDALTINFGIASAGATVNALLAGCNTRAIVLSHPPIDADTVAFFGFLRALGVSLASGADDIAMLSPYPSAHRVEFELPPDRNDTVTWMTAGALSSSGIAIVGADAEDVAPAVSVWRRLGAGVDVTSSSLIVRQRSDSPLLMEQGFRIVGGASPGFHSDWLPFLHLLMTQASGEGTAIDTLHSHRVRQAEILMSMGANVHILGGPPPGDVSTIFDPVGDSSAKYIVSIVGPAELHGVRLRVGNDVRACAAACIAATVATGSSELMEVGALDRGYQRFRQRLENLII